MPVLDQAVGQVPSGGTGSVTAPKPMLGAQAQAAALVRTGIEMLQKAIQAIPIGSELHTSVLKAIVDVSRRMEPGTESSVNTQVLANLARANQQNPQQAAVMERLFPQAQPVAPPPEAS